MSEYLKNTGSQPITAMMLSAEDGSALTTSVTVAVDGSAGGGSLAHVAGGLWSYTPTQAETNADQFTVVFAHAAGISQSVQVYTTTKRLRDLQDPTVSAIQSGLMLTNDANVAAIKAKTDLLGFTGSLVNATVSGVATSANQSTMQASLTAIKAITDQFTFTDGTVDANATVDGTEILEAIEAIEFPLVITPPVTVQVGQLVIASSVGGVVRNLELFQESEATITWQVTDGTDEPLDMSGHSFAFVIHRKAAVLSVIDGASITTSASDESTPAVEDVVAVELSPSDLETTGDYEYKLWDLDLNIVLGSGRLRISVAPKSLGSS